MRTALIIIDVQNAIDDPSWSKLGPRNNPTAEQKIHYLLDTWRNAGAPIYHIRHDSVESNSTYRPGQTGNEYKSEVAPLYSEIVVAKHTGSAFVNTGLETQLRSANIDNLVICGVITNNSVESTVRNAGDLGFNTYLVEDACFTFAKRDWSGRVRAAEEVHAMSLANLHGEYCAVISTETAIKLIP